MLCDIKTMALINVSGSIEIKLPQQQLKGDGRFLCLASHGTGRKRQSITTVLIKARRNSNVMVGLSEMTCLGSPLFQ